MASSSTVPYVVRSGDYLSSIARNFGTTPDAIWSDPANADLKKKRRNPEILAPGDVLFLRRVKPKWLSVTVGSTNSFTGKVPTAQVQVVLRDSAGTPLANKNVTTSPKLGDDPLSTDGSGLLTLVVPLTLRTISVVVADSGPRFDIRVGGLDPHDTPSGLLSRLRQLGHVAHEDHAIGRRSWLMPHARAVGQLALARGIESFQRANDREVTGEPSADLHDAVRQAHGC